MDVCYGHALKNYSFGANNLEERSLIWDPETFLSKVLGMCFYAFFWEDGDEILDVKGIIDDLKKSLKSLWPHYVQNKNNNNILSWV